MAYPIWKDKIVTLATGVYTGVDFRIVLDSSVIYTGRAFPVPGSTTAYAKINDICADYLTRALPLEGVGDYYDATFTIQVYNAGALVWEDVEQVTFTRDWSYDDTFDADTDIPVAPVTKYLHPLQYLPIFSNSGTFEADFLGDYNLDFNLDFNTAGYVNYLSDGITYFLDLSEHPGWSSVQANGITYRAADLCGGYVLYYINAYGGWDSLPVQGRTIKSQGLTRYTKENEYDNGTYPARGTENYVNEIAQMYKLNIGPLTTEQSSLMHHLLGSTFVYLHDIEAGRIHPVTLTGTSYEIKDRRGVLHFYEVEAALAQNRMRR